MVTLLKRDHGIDVKSASSTIEEVVARQFVERHARQRGITLPPPAQMFLETAVPAKGGAKKAPARAPEPPPKPAAPVVGPPRLVRTITPRPAPLPVEGDVAADATGSAPAAPAAEARPAAPPAIRRSRTRRRPRPSRSRPSRPSPSRRRRRGAAGARAGRGGGAAGARRARAARHRGVGHPRRRAPAAPVAEAAEPAPAPDETKGDPITSAVQPAAARPQGPVGRIVPPTLRLRIEDPAAPQTEGRSRVAAPPRLTRPAPAQPAAPSAPAAPAPAAAQPAAAGGTGARRRRARRCPALRSVCRCRVRPACRRPARRRRFPAARW